jgi:hypothetical protein
MASDSAARVDTKVMQSHCLWYRSHPPREADSVTLVSATHEQADTKVRLRRSSRTDRTCARARADSLLQGRPSERTNRLRVQVIALGERCRLLRVPDPVPERSRRGRFGDDVSGSGQLTPHGCGARSSSTHGGRILSTCAGDQVLPGLKVPGHPGCRGAPDLAPGLRFARPALANFSCVFNSLCCLLRAGLECVRL